MKRSLTRGLVALVGACVLPLTGCNNQLVPGTTNDAPAARSIPNPIGARSLSRHYVEVKFPVDVSELVQFADHFVIETADGSNRLAVLEAQVGTDSSKVVLATGAQDERPYHLSVLDQNASADVAEPQFVTFSGSTLPEPELLGAIALDSATVLLTFSEAMNPPVAENTAFYHILDPDGRPDVDIRVIGATLGIDGTTVALTTTPQENTEYTIQVSNLAAAFRHSERCLGENILFEGTSIVRCAPSLRPVNTEGFAASVELTARTRVDQSAPLDPDAAGELGHPYLWSGGAGVVRTTCFGSNTLSGGTFSDRDEELIITFDAPVQREALSLGFSDISFISDEPVIFVAGAGVGSFDFTVEESDMLTAFLQTDAVRGTLDFGGLSPLPNFLMIDAIKIRETRSATRVGGLCISAPRRLDPTTSAATFFGIPPVDLTPPRVLDAVATSNTSILVSFSEPLREGAADPLNFSMSPELVIVDAEATLFNTQVVIRTLPMQAGVEYTLTVQNVQDLAGNVIGSGAVAGVDNTAIFLFPGNTVFEVQLPRVVGAISTGNTTVIVAFSKPMGDSALVSSHYSIVQVNINPEVGALSVAGNHCDAAADNAGEVCSDDSGCPNGTCVLSPRFLGPDRTSVELHTSSQNEVTYEVSVVNVRDLEGNPLAAPEILVNPSKAEFAGTPAAGVQIVDTDGDGLTDNEETRGYVILITRVGGEIDSREVTSDPNLVDTDGDGLTDLDERVRFSDPRSSDTDVDTLSDFDEVFIWGTSLTNQDTDGDGLRDSSEVGFFKTSPLFADTDGDGLFDNEEIPLGNRDPRIADLPDPGITVSQIALRLDTRFVFTDTQGESSSVERSTSATLSQSDSKTFSTSDSSTNQHAVQVSGEFGHEFSASPKTSVKVGLSYGYTRENTFTASQSSTQETQRQFQESLSISVSRDVSQSITRSVEGASVQVLVTIDNAGDIPFTVRNIELTGLLQDPFDRSSFQPVATLLPSSELLGTGGLDISLGPFIRERGPFVFENREVFPSLVEDLMKNPRGLIFKVANFDIVDEDGRNFAFLTQDVNDRTAGLIIDFGTGAVDRRRVSTHSRFDMNECDALSDNRGDFCRSDADCTNGTCDLSNGMPIGVSMAFVLQDILGMKKNEPFNAITIGPNGCGETAAIGDDVQVVSPICLPVEIGGEIILAGPNGVLDTIPVGDDIKDPTGTKILDGGDACAQTRASRDDVQVVPGLCERAFPDGVMVLPGPNGTFETPKQGDDELATVTGYETTISGACDGNTESLIAPGENEVLDTSPAQGDDTIFGEQVLPGPNEVLETTPEGDDVLQGPGLGCELDSDCPGGTCKAVERLVRVKGVKNNLGEQRFWILLTDRTIAPDVNFDDIRMQSGDEISLAYVQDRDGDGLFAREEYLYGSSDLDDNTDGCPLGDGEDGCTRERFDFDSILDFDEVRRGWEIDVAGVRNYFSFPNPVLPDTDADRLFDDEEQNLGTDPGKRDTDDDELSDHAEVRGFDILRRDGLLIRTVPPYQSAIITPGGDTTLDTTTLVDDDEFGMNPAGQSIVIPGLNGVIDTIPKDDDVLETTELILDGGNGASETVAQNDDLQIGPAPASSTTVDVSFLQFEARGDACDQLLPGEYHFDFRLDNGFGIVSTFTEDAIVQRNTPFVFSTNQTNVFLTPEATMTLFITIRESDPQCNFRTRRTVVEPLAYIVDGGNGIVDTVASGFDVQIVAFGDPVRAGDAIIVAGADGVLDTLPGVGDVLTGAYIVEPHSGGNLIANSAVRTDVNDNPLNDDVQEVPLGDPVLPGQVIISPGPNGILESVAHVDDIVPIPNGFGDTLALGDDQQVVGLAQPTRPGQVIVACGLNHEPDPMMAAAKPGICAAFGGDAVRRPDACAEVIRQPTGSDGIAETSKDGDDIQVIDLDDFAAAGAVVIERGANKTIDSTAATQFIELDLGGLFTTTPQNDDVLKNGRIFPGPDGMLDTLPAFSDVLKMADDEFEAASVPAGLDCSLCPTGACVIDCSLCGDGSCVGDDVLLVRGAGDLCEDGVCPCGSCGSGPFDEVSFSLDFDVNQLSFLPTDLPIRNRALFVGSRPGPFGIPIPIFYTIGDVFTTCFASSILTVRLNESLGAMADKGSVLIRPGPDGVLDTEPSGDDVKGARHLTLFATDPLNRDTDGDGLFDGAEAVLGANPNDATDASKFRDTDLDGLVNIEETDGWFVGFTDRTGTFCRNALGDFILVPDVFAPPIECPFVFADRFEPDTDFDGLPDLLERLIRSDPTKADTDGDGLLDLDEFDPDSSFSVNVGTFREFTRRCADAERCTFAPIDEPFGTSVVLADTDGDGLDDRTEIFDTFVIFPCINDEQLPIVVSSSPFSADADRDGVNDSAEKAQGTDPQNPDTDEDGMVDDPTIDKQADGCGKTLTISVDSFMTGDDDCDGGARGDGDFVFTVHINGPGSTVSTITGSANLGSNSPFNFGSNQTVFILRPGESFTITGLVNEQDDGGASDENWNLGTITFPVGSFGNGPNTRSIAPSSPGSGAADGCYDGANITLTITLSSA